MKNIVKYLNRYFKEFQKKILKRLKRKSPKIETITFEGSLNSVRQQSQDFFKSKNVKILSSSSSTSKRDPLYYDTKPFVLTTSYTYYFI